jgi:hypothetical protein
LNASGGEEKRGSNVLGCVTLSRIVTCDENEVTVSLPGRLNSDSRRSALMTFSRADGRGNEEIRALHIVYERLDRVDGSARFGFGMSSLFV